MENKDENSKTKSFKKWLLPVVIVVILVGGIVYYFGIDKKMPLETFETSEAQYGAISNSITATGTLQPVDTVAVGSQISGVIKNIYVDFNSVVKKGQLIASIDPSIIQAQKDESLAGVANAVGNLKYQESNHERQKKLFNLGVISQADYQIAQNSFASAQAALDNSKAQLKITTQNLFYTKIYSPIDGIILNRNVSEGQTIASSFNAPTLFIIAKDLTKMQVRAAVDEADIGEVNTGQHVDFTVDAFPDEIFTGKVQQILLHAKVNSNVVTYTTLINVDNNSLKLKPGMTASITIYTKEEAKALLISSKALSFRPDSIATKQFVIIHAANTKPNIAEKANKQMAKVWSKSGDTLFEKIVSTDMNDDRNVSITEGLKLGDKVVIGQNKSIAKAPDDTKQTSPFMPKFGNRRTSKSTGQ